MMIGNDDQFDVSTPRNTHISRITSVQKQKHNCTTQALRSKLQWQKSVHFYNIILFSTPNCCVYVTL